MAVWALENTRKWYRVGPHPARLQPKSKTLSPAPVALPFPQIIANRDATEKRQERCEGGATRTRIDAHRWINVGLTYTVQCVLRDQRGQREAVVAVQAQMPRC